MDDSRWMARALALAARGRGLTSPNPMVGAVVVQDGRVVGERYHERAGGPHAEAAALAEAGARARGATLYVTLEPCNHVGRTPACVEAVVRAGVRRVVAATRDPNPRVAGDGAGVLREAGIEISLGCLEREARDLNRVFFTAMERQRPHVTLKWAMTLDGKVAAADRSSRWITGEAARREAHRLRSQSDAIVTGIGTVLADDPALTVRLDRPWPREPYRVVVDSRARLPLGATLLHTGTLARVLVAVGEEAPAARIAAIEASGATVLQCKSRDGRVDVGALCAQLFALDVIGVLLEAGSELTGSFVQAGLADRVAVFVAPKLLGGAAAPSPAGGPGLALGEALRLTDLTVRPLGDDWLFEGAVNDSRVRPS
ncbi:MAG TPA: bifunctional diaminohydroxyphosphoribosylaminopyrimidine deaminase/5-amino-6-(5-phosphoribosylamino)uracil reductase RibD [Candidatus Dormibacteraeota bacterium]|jgi:diaminohydroxyphosphoribosylaminopyrimidine deaminase/5-amino-6-(5-phosphoribosylamino)uracil reductase|nr:bifunctional diaminohydroxyphosphoribosylaminopyrimidine deaminase/5-amino-6-(5-phosphoribosylamino)uracil reductase RibD [Candidatus Dormibacteraeota bacterium]